MLPGMTSLLGATQGGNPVLQLFEASYRNVVKGGGEAASGFSLLNTGLAYGDEEAIAGPASYAWLTGGDASAYEVRADLTSGTFSSGTVGAWSPLSASQGWSVSKIGVGGKAASFNLQIRRASDGVVVAGPVNISIHASVTA